MNAQDSVAYLDKMNRILNGTQGSYRKLVTRNGVSVTDPNFSYWEDHWGNEVPCPGKYKRR